MPYRIRQLKQVGRPVSEARRYGEHRDPMGTTAAVAGPVYEVAARELTLSFDEVVERLEAHRLHTTDLIWIGGGWMTLAESPAFFEITEPYARREQRIRTVKGALTLAAIFAVYALMFCLRVFAR